MGDTYPQIRVAVVQVAPVFLDREATVEKACHLIEEAGMHCARVIGFCEGFIPGHPLWYQFHPATSAYSTKLAVRLFKNAVEIPGPVTDALCAATRAANAYVVIGMCERRPGTFGTLFNTQLFIGPNGQILGKHQKLVPTSTERLVHMAGGGDSLQAFPTDFGKLSGLICGENLNPLAIFALSLEYPLIHVASWPNHGRPSDITNPDRSEAAGRAVATMMKAYVLNVRSPVTEQIIEILAPTNDEHQAFLLDPARTEGSTIIDPRGVVVARMDSGQEGILYANLDLDLCVQMKVKHDLAGHYNRPDIFTLHINRKPFALHQYEGTFDQALSANGITAMQVEDESEAPVTA
jgi:aliphatic nitrilase